MGRLQDLETLVLQWVDSPSDYVDDGDGIPVSREELEQLKPFLRSVYQDVKTGWGRDHRWIAERCSECAKLSRKERHTEVRDIHLYISKRAVNSSLIYDANRMEG